VLAALDASTPAEAVRPSQATDATRRLWIETDRGIAPVAVRLGLSDGAFTEIADGPVREGTPLVTNVVLEERTTTATSTQRSSNPLMAAPPGPPGGFGGNR
jgi:hypothetical protein